MKTSSKRLQWFQNEITKDKQELEKEKLKFIQQIKKTKKEEIVPKKKKVSIWKIILRLFTG
jgi:hypothetical protein